MTYFEGDSKNGLEPDLEARQLWLDQGIPEDHVLPGNAKDNFWGMLSFVICYRVAYNSTSRQRWVLPARAVLVVKSIMTWSASGMWLTS